ncbi:NitT/TauT family transport system permease protein [Flexibacter flexilis DSM 6793]|uniref:NitT/TauT family transport system permease protein n=1 Tax=Flexibacter flexilis DSM 6793 TaxID=927664 RepID=A0A1I1NEM8_9BACT|nr:ABC transporter permease [Flexibacter flexilis]SFC93918.1 NitT/TauT family transport system permease protein [Flexibacter flexilis DSM 6793]
MKVSNAIYPLSLLIILVGVWCFFSNIYGVKTIFLPSPQHTLFSLWSMLQQVEFWQDLLSSWYRVFVGFLISFLIAYPISFASLLNNKLKDTIFYFIEFFRYLPVPVFIPIIILWFGIEDMSKIIIIVLGTFAQMIPMFYDSATAIEKKYSSFNFALKWSKLKYIENVIAKGSAPSILDNSRICLGWAWTYLIVAEIVGAEYGIGYAMIRAQRYLATDKIFAYIIVIGLIGILTDRSLVLMRKKLFPWNK